MSGQREIKHNATIVRLFGPWAVNILFIHLRTISAPSSMKASTDHGVCGNLKAWNELIKCCLSVWLVVKNDWNWFFLHSSQWTKFAAQHAYARFAIFTNDGSGLFCSRRNFSKAKVQVNSIVDTLPAAIGGPILESLGFFNFTTGL